MSIRKATVDDKVEWARMRNELWPGAEDNHAREIDHYFLNLSNAMVEVFVLERNNGMLGGFLELNIRNQGWGRRLMLAAEQWGVAWNFANWPAIRKSITGKVLPRTTPWDSRKWTESFAF